MGIWNLHVNLCLSIYLITDRHVARIERNAGLASIHLFGRRNQLKSVLLEPISYREHCFIIVEELFSGDFSDLEIDHYIVPMLQSSARNRERFRQDRIQYLFLWLNNFTQLNLAVESSNLEFIIYEESIIQQLESICGSHGKCHMPHIPSQNSNRWLHCTSSWCIH
jgi:hypothetical protein